MSKSQSPFDFRTFMKGIYPLFDGTYFEFNGKGYNVSRHNDDLWFKMVKEHNRANLIDPTIAFGICFCIAYQDAYKTPVSEKIFSGSKIEVAFPVPKNVQDFFKYRIPLQLDKEAESLTSKLQDLSSKITELKALLANSLEYQQELVVDVNELQIGLSDLQLKFNKADQRVRVLRNLMAATIEATSLFEIDVVVLESKFFSVLQDCETNLRFYSGQVRDLKVFISGKEKMLSEQCAAIATIETNLRQKLTKQKETESDLRKTQKEIFQELSRFEGDVLPHQLLKYVEESRLYSNKQQAAMVLAKHFKQIADRNFVGSRIKSAPTNCSICDFSKPNYFTFGCGHGHFCKSCVSQLSTCPICRASITSVSPLDLFDRKLFMQ